MPERQSSWPRLLLALPAMGVALLSTVDAEAQIKRPGAHPKYSVELEPHGELQYGDEPWGDLGFGLGGRVTIPFFHNGPISKINNNMGIGFGFDWVHFDGDCFRPFYGPQFRGDCTGTNLWFPVVMQWNFFFTDVISVFGEPGLALQFESWSYPCQFGPGGGFVDCDADDTDIEFVFWTGARFMFGDTVGLTVRLGWPSMTVGASFLL